jgi:hypothetical protein
MGRCGAGSVSPSSTETNGKTFSGPHDKPGNVQTDVRGIVLAWASFHHDTTEKQHSGAQVSGKHQTAPQEWFDTHHVTHRAGTRGKNKVFGRRVRHSKHTHQRELAALLLLVHHWLGLVSSLGHNRGAHDHLRGRLDDDRRVDHTFASTVQFIEFLADSTHGAAAHHQQVLKVRAALHRKRAVSAGKRPQTA